MEITISGTDTRKGGENYIRDGYKKGGGRTISGTDTRRGGEYYIRDGYKKLGLELYQSRRGEDILDEYKKRKGWGWGGGLSKIYTLGRN